jgi:hypothetical protein
MHRTMSWAAARVPPPAFPPEANLGATAPLGAASQVAVERSDDQVSDQASGAWTCPYDLALRTLLP